jgi:hypothetical protein
MQSFALCTMGGVFMLLGALVHRSLDFLFGARLSRRSTLASRTTLFTVFASSRRTRYSSISVCQPIARRKIAVGVVRLRQQRGRSISVDSRQARINEHHLAARRREELEPLRESASSYVIDHSTISRLKARHSVA